MESGCRCLDKEGYEFLMFAYIATTIIAIKSLGSFCMSAYILPVQNSQIKYLARITLYENHYGDQMNIFP